MLGVAGLAAVFLMVLHVDYISVRPDPDHVLQAGYVHPLLKK